MKRFLSIFAIMPLALVGCGGKEAVSTTPGIGGTLTVVTDRPDAEKLFEGIEKKFIAKYPDVKDIVWESSADYNSYITTRMNTKEYGDVLLVPFSLSATPTEYANYFEPLGKVDELKEQYMDVTEADYDGIAYGLPVAMNSLGIIYNEAVFKAAGIEAMPTSTEGFIKACQQIKDKTEAVPFFTNYNRTLPVWGGALTSFGGEQYKSDVLAAGTAFKDGQPIREIMDLFHELSSKGLIEEDPITADAAKAQQMLADGQLAMLMMGSQDVPVIQSLVKNDSKINIAPFPVQFDGKTSIPFGAPGVIGINKNSSNIPTAKAFLDFFVSAESGYADDLGGISPNKVDWTEEQKAIFKENKIILTVPTETPENEAKYNTIANEVGVGRLKDTLQQVINIGLYPEQNMRYDDYIKTLEASWEKAVQNNAK